MRAATKTVMCEWVLRAWARIDEDLVKKSFVVCGQVPDCEPKDIGCMKEGRAVHDALEKAEELWNIPYDLIDWVTMSEKVQDDVEEEDVGQDNEDIGEEVNEWEQEEEIDILNNNITEWSDEESDLSPKRIKL